MVDIEELKRAAEGGSMVPRIKYRKQVANAMTGKRPVIEKGEIFKAEHALAENLDERMKNPDFGFKCLHYSVSESSGSLRVIVVNKKKSAGRVRVKTIDADAKAEEDYGAVDKVMEFKSGEAQQSFEVKIFDDDSWEPDEDFHI